MKYLQASILRIQIEVSIDRLSNAAAKPDMTDGTRLQLAIAHVSTASCLGNSVDLTTLQQNMEALEGHVAYLAWDWGVDYINANEDDGQEWQPVTPQTLV